MYDVYQAFIWAEKLSKYYFSGLVSDFSNRFFSKRIPRTFFSFNHRYFIWFHKLTWSSHRRVVSVFRLLWRNLLIVIFLFFDFWYFDSKIWIILGPLITKVFSKLKILRKILEQKQIFSNYNYYYISRISYSMSYFSIYSKLRMFIFKFLA